MSETETHSHDRTGCFVAGCPLPGSMTSSTNGSSQWFCPMHFGTPATLWADITARISNRITLLEAARKLSNRPPRTAVPSSVVQAFEAAGRGDLLRVDGKPVPARTAGRHAWGVLEREIRQPGQQQGLEALKAAVAPAAGFQPIGALIAEAEEVGV